MSTEHIARLNQDVALILKDQAAIADALTEIATELSTREKRLDRRIDEASHEIAESAMHMKRAAMVNVDLAVAQFRAAVLKFARGVE